MQQRYETVHFHNIDNEKREESKSDISKRLNTISEYQNDMDDRSMVIVILIEFSMGSSSTVTGNASIYFV